MSLRVLFFTNDADYVTLVRVSTRCHQMVSGFLFSDLMVFEVHAFYTN